MIKHLGEVANTVGINHRLALKLCSKLEAGTKTLLRHKTAETEAEVRTEVFDLDAAINITVAVNRNLVVANLNVITVSGSNILLQPVTVSCNLNQLVATHREASRYEERA